MPLLKFTAADVLRTKVLEKGWYNVQVKTVSDFTTSKAGDSNNIKITFLVEGTEGKEIERTYNSKAMSMMIPLIAACTGQVIKPENFDFDTDTLKGKKCDGKIDIEMYEGNPKNVLNDFVPHGKGKLQGAF